MYEAIVNKCDIFIIYINEAHAADVWNIGESAGMINDSHKTIEDRIACAKKLQEKYQIDVPIYCDNMDDTIEKYFAAWPVRYYIVSPSDVIEMVSIPEDSQFDVLEIFQYIGSNY